MVLWGRQAEIAGEYLAKGRTTVYIEGRLQTRKWQDKDGRDRWTTEVIGERIQMLGGKGEGGGGRSGGRGGQEGSFGGGPTYDEPALNPDYDIPF